MSFLAACGEVATLPISAGFGPQPMLPAPQQTLIPTMHIAPAKGWPVGVTPLAAPGTHVAAFAGSLDHPRWLHVLPNGDVLVAEAERAAIWVVDITGKPAGAPVDVLTGFHSEDGNAYGRPVGVVLDRQGALLVVDDFGNVV